MPKPNSDCRATERKHPWPMVRLGDVCTIEFGTRVRRKDSQGGDYPVYGGGGATFCWSTYNREDQCIVSRFAMSEECVRFVKGKFFLNDSGLSVRSDNQDLSQTYLDWVLYSKQPEIYALGRGAAQKNLDVEQFVDMMLPLPPLSVQREIVARLERELAAVEKMKKGFEALAETARAEFKAELKEVFEEISRGGAETRRLGDVCDVRDGTHDTPAKCNKGYLLLTSIYIGGKLSFCSFVIALVLQTPQVRLATFLYTVRRYPCPCGTSFRRLYQTRRAACWTKSLPATAR